VSGDISLFRRCFNHQRDSFVGLIDQSLHHYFHRGSGENIVLCRDVYLQIDREHFFTDKRGGRAWQNQIRNRPTNIAIIRASKYTQTPWEIRNYLLHTTAFDDHPVDRRYEPLLFGADSKLVEYVEPPLHTLGRVNCQDCRDEVITTKWGFLGLQYFLDIATGLYVWKLDPGLLFVRHQWGTEFQSKFDSEPSPD